MKHKEKKITFNDLADDLMFEVFQKMTFKNTLTEEVAMKKIFKKYFKKAIKINNPDINKENGSDSTTN
ncbi:hypothetical protein M0P65_06075 [Candidatus Gracilibacteria bacterium]|jgi:hypothetical protein|nr:hypothetical protein [Candidatus Gracilibacteria bacterium]